MDIIISVALGVVCVPCGLFLGLIPLKADLVTTKQSKASQMMCFIIAMIFIALLLTGRDMETWAIIIGLVIGFAIGKIPSLHAWALNKWAFLQPKKPAPKQKRQRSKKK
jgi:uncharacterized membrane protein YqgA involved in biofilm formation